MGRRGAYRKQDEENVTDDIASAGRPDTHGHWPGRPVLTLAVIVMSPATELLVEIELATAVTLLAVSSLDVTEPVRGNVDDGSNTSHRNTSCNEDNPDLAGIEKVS